MIGRFSLTSVIVWLFSPKISLNKKVTSNGTEEGKKNRKEKRGGEGRGEQVQCLTKMVVLCAVYVEHV